MFSFHWLSFVQIDPRPARALAPGLALAEKQFFGAHIDRTSTVLTTLTAGEDGDGGQHSITRMERR